MGSTNWTCWVLKTVEWLGKLGVNLGRVKKEIYIDQGTWYKMLKDPINYIFKKIWYRSRWRTQNEPNGIFRRCFLSVCLVWARSYSTYLLFIYYGFRFCVFIVCVCVHASIFVCILPFLFFCLICLIVASLMFISLFSKVKKAWR